MATVAKADINVVASFKPIHSLVAGVMNGVGQPHLLLESGSPHTYALKPSNARALQHADLVFWIGPRLETFLAEPLKTLARKARITPLGKVEKLTRHPSRNKNHNHDHDHGSNDPHMWLDPVNAKAFIKAISVALAERDPDHTSEYMKNAQAMTARLEKLTHELQATLAPIKNKPFLTFHDSFQYFEKRFGLNHAGSIAINPDRQPGARHLVGLRKMIKQRRISCIFSEPQFRPKLIRLIIEGSSTRIGTLDPVGARLKKGPELYVSLLRNNARAFISCLGKD